MHRERIYHFPLIKPFAVAFIAVTAMMLPVSEANAQVEPVISCSGRQVTSLSFSNPTLISGTDLQVGAVYRFSNVATAIDALVEITGFVNGGALSTIDRDTGLVNYFQPELQTSASGTGAADIQISFVQSGTSAAVNLDIAASSIDVDGNNANLREYVEYEDTSSGHVLNSTTRLDRNASGPTPGRNRYESRTPQVAPGIDPTAEDNIVTVFYTDVSSFEFRVGSLGSGNMTRLTAQGFDCPNMSNPIYTPEIREDFGDAPLNNYGNPMHTLIPGVQLGANITNETAPFDSATASADTGDDGVILPDFEQGQTETITVDVSGAGGYLQGWIDWNDDGDISDPGEQIATNVQDDDGDGQITLSILTPATAALGNTIARFRWSTAFGVGPQEPARDGEVEDYQVSIIDPPAAPLTCPAGFAHQAGTGNAGTVIVNAQNGDRAIGNLSPAGSGANPVSARIRPPNPTLTLQLEDIVPENADITISIARDNNSANARIEGSLDGVSYTTITTFNSPANDSLNHIMVSAIPGGMEFIRFQRLAGRTWIDGVQYSDICAPTAATTLDAQKTVAVYDPENLGIYALPGNDVIYTISVSNIGGGAVDLDSLELIDGLPSEIEFWNGDIDDDGPETDPVSFTQSAGAGLTFTYGTDVRFGTGGTKPIDFDSCTIIAPDSTYRPDLTFICFNPKGAMNAGNPDPSFSVSFRSRIK